MITTALVSIRPNTLLTEAKQQLQYQTHTHTAGYPISFCTEHTRDNLHFKKQVKKKTEHTGIALISSKTRCKQSTLSLFFTRKTDHTGITPWVLPRLSLHWASQVISRFVFLIFFDLNFSRLSPHWASWAISRFKVQGQGLGTVFRFRISKGLGPCAQVVI